MKFPNVPSTSVKLMLFLFSLKGAARIWLEKEPHRSILIWDDLVSKFINKFFPPSKTTNLRNEITRFQQRFDETFYEAWDRFNDLLRACPHHGFSELHQLDTFYNALNSNDQDSLNSVVGGNFLDKMPRDCLRIIESKSKVHNSRSKPVVAKVSSSSSTPDISPDVAELKDMVKALLLDKKKPNPSSRSRKSGSGTLPSNTITNPKVDLKGITTRSGVAYQGPTIPTTFFPPKVVEHETEVTKDTVSPTNNGTLIGNKEKLSEMARTPLNEHCSAVILNKLPEKLGDLGKFLIPCDFPGMDECLALADLGLAINLMPHFPCGKSLSLSLSFLPGAFHSYLYSSNYDDMMANRIDVIKMACGESSQEVLGFSDVITSGNPTPYYDPIISTSSPTLTPFGDSDFLLEEEDILLLESFLNDDPSLPLPLIGKLVAEIRKELKVYEAKTDKSSIDKPPKVKLKDLPPHLEYAFLESDDKLPVIIAKDLSVEEKAALIKVLKSHKRATLGKLSGIKGLTRNFVYSQDLWKRTTQTGFKHTKTGESENPRCHQKGG
ncbi:reverse transcriptase domain-containing protein [Tanacetum coccineum]